MQIWIALVVIGLIAGRLLGEPVTADHGAGMLWIMCFLCGAISCMLFWELSPASFFPGAPAAFSFGQLLGMLIPRPKKS